MKYRNCLIACDRGGPVTVVDWPAGQLVVGNFPIWGGACRSFIHELSQDEINAQILSDFWKLVLEYGCDPRAVDLAFLNIDEYRMITGRMAARET